MLPIQTKAVEFKHNFKDLTLKRRSEVQSNVIEFPYIISYMLSVETMAIGNIVLNNSIEHYYHFALQINQLPFGERSEVFIWYFL